MVPNITGDNTHMRTLSACNFIVNLTLPCVVLPLGVSLGCAEMGQASIRVPSADHRGLRSVQC